MVVLRSASRDVTVAAGGIERIFMAEAPKVRGDAEASENATT
jgi:hypothetical protein